MADPRECARCHRVKRIVARDLCKTCYESERVSGNLGKYTDHRYRNGLSKIACGQCSKVFFSYPTTSGPRKYCSRHCYEIAERVTTEQDDKRIMVMFRDGLSASKIAKRFKTTSGTIIDILERNGISSRPGWYYARRYTTNEHAFDDLDNELSSYWLGFIYADGHIGKSGLQISLKSSDSHHLEKLATFLESACPVRPTKIGTCYIAFCGIHIAKSLNGLGVISRRGQFYRVLDNLPRQQYAHFIRGYLDGDGYISATGAKSRCDVGFCGQDDILTWIKQILSENCPQIGNPQIRPRRGIKELCFGGHRQASSIIKWLYKDANIYLLRKYERAVYWMTL
jgi:hypothetical protein